MKWHKIIKTNTGKRIAHMCRAIRAVEDAIDEYIPIDVEVSSIDVSMRNDTIECRICTEPCIEYTVTVESRGFRIRISCTCRDCRDTFSYMYRDVATQFLSYALSEIGHYIFRDNEYCMILTLDGYTMIMEGFRDHTVHPSNIEIAGIAHTHPASSCAFSRRDVLTALDLLSRGSLVFCAIGIDGVLCMYRKGLLLVEDHDKLILSDSNVYTYEVLESLNLKSISFLRH